MDETKTEQDTSQTGDSSSEEKGSTSKKGPQTLTESEAKAREQKAASDALSTAGRDAKTLDTGKEQLQAGRKKLDDDRAQWLKDQDEREREAVGGDPEALKSLETKQQQRTRDAELTQREREQTEKEETHQEVVKSDLETIRVFNRTKLAAEVAVAKGVSMDSILKHAKDDSREAMEAVAEDLPKKEEKEPLKLDSSKTIGGGDMPESARGKMRSGWDELHESK